MATEPAGARPNSEIDEMHKRIDILYKYNLLRGNFMILAQTFHAVSASQFRHMSVKFQDCDSSICQEFAKTLEMTKL